MLSTPQRLGLGAGGGWRPRRAGPSSLAVPVSPMTSPPASTSEAQTGRARLHLLPAERVSLNTFTRTGAFLAADAAALPFASLCRWPAAAPATPHPEAAADISLPHP